MGLLGPLLRGCVGGGTPPAFKKPLTSPRRTWPPSATCMAQPPVGGQPPRRDPSVQMLNKEIRWVGAARFLHVLQSTDVENGYELFLSPKLNYYFCCFEFSEHGFFSEVVSYNIICFFRVI